MIYSLRLLNKSIDRWISQKITNAPDKEYAKTQLISQLIESEKICSWSKQLNHHPLFKEIYSKYKLGNNGEIEKLFADDNNSILLYLDPDEIKDLLKRGTIEIVKVKKLEKNFLNIERPVLPIKWVDGYKIIDQDFKREPYQFIREAIKIAEIQRKIKPSGRIIQNDIGKIKQLDQKIEERPIAVLKNLHFILKDNSQITKKQILCIYQRLKEMHFINGNAKQFRAL
ncbi:MAG: hypothetical protein ACYCOO_11785, partial [Chitinophagaceae bacterium]